MRKNACPRDGTEAAAEFRLVTVLAALAAAALALADHGWSGYDGNTPLKVAVLAIAAANVSGRPASATPSMACAHAADRAVRNRPD